MSKSYKKKREQEVAIEENDTLSKKEQYDLEKSKRLVQKEKEQKKKKNSQKKKTSKKNCQTNLAGRIFAVVMLILMIGSVAASVAAYLG